MHNRLEAAARLLIRVSIALFTGVVLLLAQSIFWNDAVVAQLRAVLLGVAILAFFRPHNALLLLAALAPLAQIWAPLLGSHMRGGEAMVLAFLAGTLLRGWTLGGFRSFPSDRLQTAAAAFACVVAASCLEQLLFMQIQSDYPGPFLRDTIAHLSRSYFTSFRGYESVFRTMLLLEGLALLVSVRHYCRIRPGLASQFVRIVIAGAVSAALFNMAFFVKELIATGAPHDQFVRFATETRWSAHIGDLNAAGSIFVMGMFMAFGLAYASPSKRFAWALAGLMLGVAMWMTGSRTALVAALLVTFLTITIGTLKRACSIRATMAIAVAALAMASVAIWLFVPLESLGRSAPAAVTIRWLFLGTTWRMLLTEPWFGMGIGQYSLWSFHFAAPEMLNYYRHQNAHNNFAQIGGELGLVGLAAFLVVLATAFWRTLLPQRQAPHFFVWPTLLGLAAFIVTWLGGHPLLVPEVAYPFWIALGVVAGLESSDRSNWKPAGLISLVLIVLLASVPVRVERKAVRLDLSRVRFGFSAQHLVATRGRFFVRADRAQLSLPLRAWGASDHRPIEVDVFVDRRLTRSLRLTDSDWRSERIDLRESGARGFHQIDLQVKSPTILDDVESRSRRGIQLGDWEIMPKPNG
ncbi:MAG TPA: O-antigen ligase family protein [Vicinamibacterales bacterium]|nr:O-antigen ligase family protein [Vicinamibacterales bacterium]